jgi:hypothetical protein
MVFWFYPETQRASQRSLGACSSGVIPFPRRERGGELLIPAAPERIPVGTPK